MSLCLRGESFVWFSVSLCLCGESLFSCLTHAEVVRRAGPDLNHMALEKIMERESHRIERPPLVWAMLRVHEGPGAHEALNGAGQGRKLAW